MSDNFYRAFEDQYRGSRELIKSRLRVYLPLLEPLVGLYPDAKAIDLGCGRGEWLEMMKEAGLKPCGVDLDEGMLSCCLELKLPAEKGDAVAFLAALPDESQVVVSAFHVVEHISFAQLRTVVSEALRVLKPGGLLIMETPNPENLIVATRTFYLDPTHLHPIPPQLLSFLPEYYGFKRVATLRLQESEGLSGGKAPLTVLDVLGGVSPDYAVVAQKAANPKQMALFDAVFQQHHGLSLETLAQKYEAQISTVETAIEKAAAEAAAEARFQKSEIMVHQLQGELNVAQIHLGEKSTALVSCEATLAEQRAHNQRLENEWNVDRIKIVELNQALKETMARRHESQIATGRAEARAQQLQSELNAAQAQLGERITALAGCEATLAEQRANNQRLENELSSAKERIGGLNQEIKEILAQRYEAQVATVEAESRVLKLQSELSAAQVQLGEKSAVISSREAALAEQSANIQRLENEWNAATVKIDELHQSNHHWWAAAERLSRELQAIHASRSMRCTAPLRWMDRQIKRLCAEGLLARLKALVKKISRHASRRCSCLAVKCPSIKIKAQGRLQRWLDRQIKRLRVEGLFARLRALVKKISRYISRRCGCLVFKSPTIKMKEQDRLLVPEPEVVDVSPDLTQTVSGVETGTDVPHMIPAVPECAYSGKTVAVLAPGAMSGTVGGAERFYSGLVSALREKGCEVKLVCITVDESSFEHIQQGYKDFSEFDLKDFDLVISTKAPTYVVNHPNHILYLVHTVRVFYDMFGDVFPAPTPQMLAQREWIHKADSAAIARIPARFSIGTEVSRRLQHWNGCTAEVLHPPMDISGLYDLGIGDYFFMPGRLHAWKRVDLAINAIKLSGLPLRLVISGTGEAEQALRDLAGNDNRIEFLGRVDDDRLKELYAGALAVPFLPLREDYGYVTLEAFASGKPVVTCTDSGEPTEFVVDGETGLVCAPDPQAVCSAFERLWKDRDAAARMGRAGREKTADIKWSKVAERLLEAGFPDVKMPQRIGRVPLKVAVLDMQPIIPAVGGGRLRLLGLYHGLGANIEARYVGTYDWPGEKYRRHFVSPTLEEIDVPLSAAHHQAAADASRKAGGKTVIDMVFGRQAHLSSEYLAATTDAVKWADIVVFSHPWVFPLVDEELLVGKIVVYDSQNVERTLRGQILDTQNPFERDILDYVDYAERRVGDRADLILACSEEDVTGFSLLYNWPRTKIRTVPNGVFSQIILPPTGEQKQAARRSLRIGEEWTVAFFIGSDYAPNVEAARIIIEELAPNLPDVLFAIAGGVCGRVAGNLPDNVKLAGFLEESEKHSWLHAADMAVNPMCSGSGTNIKMFDFMAAALPIVSTAIGARGIVDRSTEGIRIADRTQLVAEIRQLLATASTVEAAGLGNRKVVEQKFSWDRISHDLGVQLRSAHFRKTGAALLANASAEKQQRIAHLSTVGIKCGIGEYTKSIMNAYRECGIENLILTCESAMESPVLTGHGEETQVGWFFDNRSWRKSHIKPDVIEKLIAWRATGVLIQYHPGFYSPEMLCDFVLACIENGIKAVVVVHNFTVESVSSLRAINQMGIKVFSHRGTEVHLARLHDLQLELVPLGIDVQAPIPVRDIANRNWCERPPVIITNGFLRKHKGVRYLVKGMPFVLRRFPGAQLIIQCSLYPSDDSMEELEACREEIKQNGLDANVIFDTRFLEKQQVLEELSKADIAVLPYEKSSEGGSASAGDALAVGLPLIVSTAEIFDGIREVVVTTDPDPEPLALAIVDLLSSPDKYHFLAEGAVAYAKENSWGNVAGTFLAAL